MFRTLTLAVCAALLSGATVTFTADHHSILANPERGFHATANPPGPGGTPVDTFEASTASWTAPLNQATLTANRVNLGITLQAIRYNLSNWRTAAISQAFLDRVSADCATARAAGVKVIVRFVYGWVGLRPDTTRAWIIAHIDQLQPVLLANADVIAWFDAGFIGHWGEWHSSSNGLLGPYDPSIYQYGDNITADSRAILDRLFLQWPANRPILLRYPRQKSQYFHPSYGGDPWWDPTAMPQTNAAHGAANVARAGNLNDSFLSDDFDGSYGYGSITDASVVALKARIASENRYVPQCGELDMGLGATAANNTAAKAPAILAKLASMRWSAFNLLDNNTTSSFQSIWQTAGSIPADSSITGAATTLYDEAARRLGYRLRLVSATLPDAAMAGTTATFSLTLRNDGFTAPVNPRTVRLVLRGPGATEIATTVAADPRTWLPGADLVVPANWTLPAGLAAGSYTVFLHLAAPEASLAARPEYAIRLANTGEIWETATGYHRLGTMIVTGPLSNTAPTISNVANQTTLEDTPLSGITITVGDAETATSSLTLTATSSNTTLVPNSNLVLGGTGANRTLRVTPPANQNGTTTITLTVSDGSLTATTSFVLTVTAVNDAPTISSIANQTTSTGVATAALAFTVGDVETAAASLTVSGSSSNTTLLPNANIVLGGSGANRTVTLTPAAGQTGTATITLTVSDGTASTPTTFTLTVSAATGVPTSRGDRGCGFGIATLFLLTLSLVGLRHQRRS